MVLIVILLAGLAVALAINLLITRTEIKRISDTLQTLSTEEHSSGEIYTLSRNKGLRELAMRINALLSAQRMREKRIQKADMAFKESITGISHDLRTPLTSVSGYLQMLKKDDLPGQKRHDYLLTIERRLGALLSLLDELFEYTRLELEQPDAKGEGEKLRLNGVLLEQLAIYYGEFAHRGIEPELSVPEQPVTVFCNKGALERIFQNLIKNALVHGGNKLAVSLKVESGMATVSFANPAELGEIDPDKLFERFYTADSSRSGKSTGLGLAIVRRLAEAIGGRAGAKHSNGILEIYVCMPLV